MKVQPIAAPAAQPQAQAGNSSREKAMAAFMQTPAVPVQNQNAITPEEIPGNTAAVPQEAGQADPIESKPEDKVETPEQQAMSRQFAQLARQEKALRQKALQQEQSFKAREDAIKLKESQYKDPDYSNYVQKDLFKKDPLAALQQVGTNYDELTQQVLSTPLDPRVENHISTLEAKLKSFEDKFGNLEKANADRETAAYDSALIQIEKDAKSLVDADDTYEMIKATNSHKDVVQLIKETFDKDGTLLTVEEAAQAVEDYLTEEAIKLSSTNKIKTKLASLVAPKTPAVQTPVSPKQPQMKTLTNATASTQQISTRQRAINAFNGVKT